jgi:sugar lactone lactonase YvrE
MPTRHPLRVALAALALALPLACEDSSTGPDGTPSEPQIEVLATGLRAPQGIAVDSQGRVWVAEQGSGSDDSRISMITADGTVHTVLDGLPSNLVMGSPAGVNHLLIQGGTLWGAQGLGEDDPRSNLLRIDISGFEAGDPPLTMADVVVEEIGPFVLAEDPSGTGQTNIYNLAFGFGGDLFIVDASANAVIRRSASGALEVFAVLPGIPNTTGVGPPVMQAVPTGIVFDGSRLLVSSFPGFPFPIGAARVYAIDASGTVTEFRTGLTSAVDLTLDPAGRPIVAQLADGFTADFQPNTGKILRLTDQGTETILEDLNFPSGIAFPSADLLYVTDLTGGRVLRVTF